MELSASETSALLLAAERYAQDGTGKLWTHVDATTEVLERMADAGLVTLHGSHAKLTERGAISALDFCPECGREIPQIEGRRPPHPYKVSHSAGARGSWKGMTKQQNYWCIGGYADDHRQRRSS